MDDIIKRFSRHFGEGDLIKVEIPELADDEGKPGVMYFRRRLTVADMEFLGEAKPPTRALTHLALFRLLAVQRNGEPLINSPETEDWFKNGSDSVLMQNIANRANLISIAFGQVEAEDSKGDSAPEEKP